MGITAAPIAAEPLSIKCRICGRKAPRGAKLCEECKAAVKRVRQVPTVVSQFLPLAMPGTAPNNGHDSHRRGTRAGGASRFAAPMLPGTLGACAAIAVFGSAMAVTGYLAVKEIDDDAERISIAVARFPAPVVGPRSMRSPETGETPMSPAFAQKFGAPLNADAATQASSPPLIAPKPYGIPKAAVFSMDAISHAPPGASEADHRAAAGASGEAALANPAAAAVADEPSVPDRWHLMSAALARCSSENFIAGVLCEQRARWQYCDGFWGQMPQCPAVRPADGGR
jgi:hypothetical protein